ncbi:MAG: WecB/TagA/CpsF family glycosyltransferase, partial [Candidatus Peregrinibacteria bacterium]|nr:WecB/TagA/CpsF family glycosyltransferase [Candidatus Peregrinibacteria bacterium]
MTRVNILGVPIDAVSMHEAVKRIQEMLKGGKHHVMTPNSEMLVCAQRNDSFRSLLNHTDLNVADSAGLLWAARQTGQSLPERVAGVDLVETLLMTISSEHPVFFLGGRNGVAEKAARRLKMENGTLNMTSYEGSPSPEDAPEIIQRINDSGAHLLLVAYGAPA